MATLVDVRERLVTVRPEVRTALALSALLLLYSNGTSGFPHDTRDQFLLWTNLALGAALLLWAFAGARMDERELGLDRRSAPASAMFGVILSVLAAVPPVLFVVLAPLFNGGPVEAPEITKKSGAGLAYFLLFRQPVGTALFEEVTFRGVLYAAWARAGGDKLAILASSAVFSLWHIVITSRTVIESGVVSTPVTTTLGILVSLAGLFVGGLIFAYLRWHTRSIAAAAVGHWLIVAFMTVAVWAMA